MNKRIIGSLAAGGVVFAGAYAFAATMSLSSDTLGADDVAVTNACDASVSYSTTAYDSTIPGYKVTNVTVTPSGTACTNKTFKVELTGAGNASLASGGGTFTDNSTAVPVALTGTAPAASVTKAFAVVTGGPAAP